MKSPISSILAALLLLAPCASAVDTDGDALEDTVEATLGSNPNHKDIFVEVDWLIVNGRDMAPRAGVIEKLQAAFAAAPVTNPDGIGGVTLHVDLSDAIADSRDAIGSDDAAGEYEWGDFDAIKAANFTPSRWATHHYCLFAKAIGGYGGVPTTISGTSRNGADFTAGASDFIVSLGADTWYEWPSSSLYYLVQTGTFMHELGHNLGLMHGGVDHVNYKPNFLSVMNYLFQLWGVLHNGVSEYDYSRIKLPDLNEKSLNEKKGLGSGAAGWGTGWHLDNGHGGFQYYEVLSASKKVDWNKDGKKKSGVKADINRDGTRKSNGAYVPKTGVLKGGVDEWTRVSFGGGLVGGARAESTLLRATHAPSCLTFDDAARHTRVIGPGGER